MRCVIIKTMPYFKFIILLIGLISLFFFQSVLSARVPLLWSLFSNQTQKTQKPEIRRKLSDKPEKKINDKKSDNNKETKIDNFITIVGSDKESILLVHRSLRKSVFEITKKWFGAELPSLGQVYVRLKINPEFGETDIAGSVGRTDGGMLYCDLEVGSPRGCERLAKHEMVHVILSNFNFALNEEKIKIPSWIHEGVAMIETYGDNSEFNARRAIRYFIIADKKSESNMIRDIKELIKKPYLGGEDKEGYAYGHILVNFLLHKGKEKDLIVFIAKFLKNGDYDEAATAYGYKKMDDLITDAVKWSRIDAEKNKPKPLIP